MYYRNFGLNGPPFQFTPSPRQLYMSAGHREGLAALEWGVLHEPSGFTLLVGETGTGKTTLVMVILARNYESVRTACVTNPRLGFEDMLREIARQLQIEPRPNKAEMLNAFDRFLAQLERGERVVIIVDEAQGLNDETLEELRLFSNRDRSYEKQLHFVLVGQPELLHRLMQPKARQFNDRIGARTIVNSLTIEQAVGYVEWRMKAQGGNPTKVFARGALRYLIDHSDGIPRRINVLCHNAMLLAYSAGQRGVDLRSARAAVAEYENLFASRGGHTKTPPMRRLYGFLRAGTPAAGVFALGLLSFGSTLHLGFAASALSGADACGRSCGGKCRSRRAGADRDEYNFASPWFARANSCGE
jgi:general secretion pathway protein A